MPRTLARMDRMCSYAHIHARKHIHTGTAAARMKLHRLIHKYKNIHTQARPWLAWIVVVFVCLLPEVSPCMHASSFMCVYMCVITHTYTHTNVYTTQLFIY